MWGLSKDSSHLSNKKHKQEKEGRLTENFRVENFIPGLIIGFIFGLFLDLTNPTKNSIKKKNFLPGKSQQQSLVSNNGDRELKMVFVVRQDLKMGTGKIASQCARKIPKLLQFQVLQFLLVDNTLDHSLNHFILSCCILYLIESIFCSHADAATGIYSELLQSQRSVLSRWEQCGQPKIVVACKNQQEMNKLQETADSFGLPTFVVADAGRTQVLAGSKTVLAIGPGPKASVDSVTGKLHLL